MAMNHDYIEEHQVLDRYVMGRLSEAEADGFEDHYLTCGECLRRLEMADKFQRGFRQVAAEEATGLLAVLASALRARRGLAFGSVFALALVVFGWLAVRQAQMGGDLEAMRAHLVQARESGDAAARRAAAAGKELDSMRARLSEERARLENALKERAAAEIDQKRLPQTAGVWLVTLVPARSGPTEGEPFQRITLPPKPERIVLELDLDLSGPDAYRVTLRRRDGATVWTATELRPGPAGTLAIGIDPSLLGPGDYRLLVESQPAGGQPFPAGRFSFRVAR